LAVWMRAGLAGLIALLILLGLTLVSAARWSRKRAWDDQSWLGPAILGSATAFIASSSVGTYLTNPESIVVLTGILALACALAKEMATESTKALA
jgi:hypothetical protein